MDFLKLKNLTLNGSQFQFFALTFALILYFGTIDYAHSQFEEDEEFTDSSVVSNTVFGIEKTKKNNNAFHFELSFTDFSIQPDIFYDDNLNSEKLKLQGTNLALGKGFALGSLLFATIDLRGMQASGKSVLSTQKLDRKSGLLSYQGVIHLGLNIHSLMIDHASVHPFVGYGVYQSTFTDTYLNSKISTNFNKIIESGFMIEAGLNFIDQYSGLYSTFRAVKFTPSNNRKYDSDTNDGNFAIYDQSTIGTEKATYYSFGFGIKF